MEATVDICFKIAQIRNLSDRYLRSLFVRLSVRVGQQQASPYQIIASHSNPSSITLFDYVSPMCSFGPQNTAPLH